MQIDNIKEQKKKLRSVFKDLRNSDLMNKEKNDNNVFNNIITSSLLSKVKRVYIYVSTEIEVDTKKLISWLFDKNIEVAVPKCNTETCEMKFYIISSFDDLKSGSYNILEPDVDKCISAEYIESCACIVPGLSFDNSGFRLGFGKGYYDRFLADFKGIKIGLCYENCLSDNLPRDEYDICVDFLVSEKRVVKFDKEV